MEENYNKLSENEIKNELIKVKGWTINKNKLTILSGFRALQQKEIRTIQLTSDLGDSQFEKQTSTVFWNQFKYQGILMNIKILIGLDNEYGFFSLKVGFIIYIQSLCF